MFMHNFGCYCEGKDNGVQWIWNDIRKERREGEGRN